jgi:hypothetical protein
VGGRVIRTALAEGSATRLRRPLSRPWCWPVDPGDVARAQALGFAPPSPPLPGHTLAVTLSPRVVWEVAPGSGGWPLVGEAAATAWRAPRVAARALPFAPALERVAAPTTLGLFDLAAEACLSPAIDGGSLGLALVLAHASLFLGLPVPADLVALGTVDAAGVVGGVDGFDEKVDWLRAAAPSVRRLLVGPGAPACTGFELVGVASAAEAVERVFATATQQMPDDPDTLARAARQLRRTVWTDRPGLLDWAAVARTADAVARRLPAGAARAEAELALAVARRHLGGDEPLPWPLPAWPWLAERGIRLRAVAHVVQSWADAATPCAPHLLAEAAAHLAPAGERTDGDAMLLGALGRAWVAAGDEPRGLRVLGEAVDLWWALEREEDSTHALCEQLRVAALLGERTTVAAAAERAATLQASPAMDPGATAFLALALGQAFVSMADPVRALAALAVADVGLGSGWQHLEPSIARWRARALDALGDHTRADACRAGVRAGSVAALLAALDRALRDGDDPEGPLAALCVSEEGHVVRRLEVRSGGARAVADRYPY